MTLQMTDLAYLAQRAIDAAQAAGQMIKSAVGRAIRVEAKTTGTSRAAQVVTEIDRQSQEIILASLLPLCREYDLGLLTEESPDDGSRFEKDFFWAIDPLDGTLPFTETRPGYAVSIALVARDGVPCLGVVYDPLAHTVYHAIKNGGAFRNGEAWALPPQGDAAFQEIDRGGAVMNACWVLEEAPAYFYKKIKPTDGCGCIWDYAATACLFTECGAWVSDAAGKALEFNRRDSLFMNRTGVLFASHAQVAETLLKK